MFAFWLRSISISIKLICDDRSLLFTKDIFVNISRLREFRFSGIKVSPLIVLLICH